ncbi:hypothetical protein CDAR_47551 [Caerostris darwini]|uniref:Uncharacterized protein n=1 Tax=Caerostris darwini TaxID=1538125 RepID=A0AAV4M850_9ARAC|nr:hypothetical protein CDAR_47551 [Caerostris darwini]
MIENLHKRKKKTSTAVNHRPFRVSLRNRVEAKRCLEANDANEEVIKKAKIATFRDIFVRKMSVHPHLRPTSRRRAASLKGPFTREVNLKWTLQLF